MKKNYLTLPLLVASLFAASQKTPFSSYKKQRVSQTDIQALFSLYTQEGDHSAITGGIGTEKLTVYVRELTITHKRDSANSYEINTGVDVITSASKDNIDFAMSSASRVDARIYVNPSYTHLFNHNIKATIGTGFSVESDYTSIPLSLSISKSNPAASSEITATCKAFFDDLRWGRLDIDIQKPVKLIYPAELRYKEWFNIYGRNSFNLQLAYSKALNPKLSIAVFPEVVYQHGLLSTPYHRIYFKQINLENVENLPLDRWKVPLAVQVNAFATNWMILKTYYRFYTDNFGIRAHTFQLEATIEINNRFTISPLIRLYTQKASKYFNEYRQHDSTETYYTSDHDLSAFNSFKLGVGFRYLPEKKLWKHFFSREINLHYSYYHRTDQLSSHLVSLLMGFRNLGIHSK
jgi:hypothetical protein